MQSRFILFPSRHKRLHSHIAFCSQFSTDGFGPKQLDFWKDRSPTSEEGPKPRVDPSPSFGKGPENMSILFSKFEGLSKARAQAWPKPYFQSPSLAGICIFRARPITTRYDLIKSYFNAIIILKSREINCINDGNRV